jgi:hypothetical protein
MPPIVPGLLRRNPSGWQRAITAALLVLPLLLLVVLSTPVWLVWPFLPDANRKAVLEFVGKLIEWTKAITGVSSDHPSPSRVEERRDNPRRGIRG